MKQLPLLSHELAEEQWAVRGEETDEELSSLSFEIRQAEKEQGRDKSISTVQPGHHFSFGFGAFIGGHVDSNRAQIFFFPRYVELFNTKQ